MTFEHTYILAIVTQPPYNNLFEQVEIICILPSLYTCHIQFSSIHIDEYDDYNEASYSLSPHSSVPSGAVCLFGGDFRFDEDPVPSSRVIPSEQCSLPAKQGTQQLFLLMVWQFNTSCNFSIVENFHRNHNWISIWLMTICSGSKYNMCVYIEPRMYIATCTALEYVNYSHTIHIENIM